MRRIRRLQKIFVHIKISAVVFFLSLSLGDYLTLSSCMLTITEKKTNIQLWSLADWVSLCGCMYMLLDKIKLMICYRCLESPRALPFSLGDWFTIASCLLTIAGKGAYLQPWSLAEWASLCGGIQLIWKKSHIILERMRMIHRLAIARVVYGTWAQLGYWLNFKRSLWDTCLTCQYSTTTIIRVTLIEWLSLLYLFWDRMKITRRE